MCAEVGDGGEAAGEPEAGAAVHVDGEEHRAGAGPGDPGPRRHPAEPLLLLAAQGRVGGAQVQDRGQAMDLAEAHDHSPQPGHRHHQPLAAKRR